MAITATRFTGSASPRQAESVALTGLKKATWTDIAPPPFTGSKVPPGPTEGRGFPR